MKPEIRRAPARGMILITAISLLVLGLPIGLPPAVASTREFTPEYQESFHSSTCDVDDDADPDPDTEDPDDAEADPCRHFAMADKSTGAIAVSGHFGVAGAGDEPTSGYGYATSNAGFTIAHTTHEPMMKIGYSVTLDIAQAHAKIASRNAAGAWIAFSVSAEHTKCDACKSSGGLFVVSTTATTDGEAASPGQRTLSVDVELINPNGGAVPSGVAEVSASVTGYAGAMNDHEESCRTFGDRHSDWATVCHPTAAAGAGSYSTEAAVSSIKATPVPAPLPAAPTNLSATALSRTQIQLNWADNAADETSYRVERSATGTEEWAVVPEASDLPADSTSFTDERLKPSTTYYYRVAAVNDYGSARSGQAAASTLANARPTVGIDGPKNAQEGETKTFSGYADDRDEDELSYSWKIFSGRAQILSPTNGTLSPKDGNDGTQVQVFFPDGDEGVQLSLQVYDEFQQTQAIYGVAVSNVAPSSAFTSGSTTPEVGTSSTYTYTVADPGDDELTVETGCGDGTKSNDTTAPGGGSFDCTFTDTVPTELTLSVRDSDGGADSDVLEVSPQARPPQNTPPQAAIEGPGSSTEGGIETFLAHATDEGGGDLTFAWSIVSGGAAIVSGADSQQARVSFSDGPAEVVMSLSVSDGTSVTEATKTVNVLNAPPSVAFTSGPITPRVNVPSRYTYRTSDPGADTVTTQPYCGAGVLSESQAAEDGGSFTCTFSAGDPTEVRVEAVDSDGAAAAPAKLAVDPQEAAQDPKPQPQPGPGPAPSGPSAENQAPRPAFTSACSRMRCEFDASGSTDPDGVVNEYAWDLGDGAVAHGVHVSHEYAAPGSYTVRLTVTDDDATSRVSTQTVVIAANTPSESEEDPEEGPDDPGAVEVRSKLSLDYLERQGIFKGRLTAARPECLSNRTVKIVRVRLGRDRHIGRDRTDESGRWRSIVAPRPRAGRYYATVDASRVTTAGTSTIHCLSARSTTVTVRA